MKAKPDLEKQIQLLVREYNMSSVLLRNAVCRKMGLNITDMECLSLLMIKSISTPTELARYTAMTTGSATVMLDRLEKANFISRNPNPKDRRGTLITINRQSTKKIATLFSDTQEAQNKLIESYSESELKTIASFLAQFTENMNFQVKSIEGGQDRNSAAV